MTTVLRGPRLARDILQSELFVQKRGGGYFSEPLKDVLDQLGFLRIDHQAVINDIVAKWRNATHPESTSLINEIYILS